jgi:hypothetical protein
VRRASNSTPSRRLEKLEPQRLVFVGENKTATSTDDLTFTPVDDDTHITYHAHVVFHGLAQLADPLMKKEFDRLGDELVTTMARALETSRTAEDRRLGALTQPPTCLSAPNR